MTESGFQVTRPLSIVSMIVTGISGGSTIVIIPGILEALAKHWGYSSAEVAYAASAELGGMTLATFGVAAVIAAVDRRRLVRVALVILMAAHLATYFLSVFPMLLVARLVAGLAEGTIIAVMTASVMSTSQPDRIFAIYMGANLATSTALLYLVSFLVGLGDQQAIFIALIALCSVALALSRFYPSFGAAVQVSAEGRQVKSSRRGAWLGLLGTLVMFIGLGSTWPLMGQYGTVLLIQPRTVASILSLAAAAGIMAAVGVTLLGNRLGRRIPLAGGTLLIAATMLALTRAHDALTFGIGVCVFLSLMVFIVPYYTSIVAVLDSRGRMASLSMGLQFCGLAFGPLLAAPLLRYGFGLSLTVAAILTLPAIALMLMVGSPGLLTDSTVDQLAKPSGVTRP